jgi:hypothetical protein
MTPRPPAIRSPFRVLFREFFGQFFASESVTSDVRLRQTMIAVAAFLLTPGYLLALKTFGAFAFAAAKGPQFIEPLTRLFATIFIAFSTVSIGFIAAFAWDTLSFDRRDAMVLGPLPISRATVVGAKLAAMAAFVVGACLLVNLPTAAAFSLSASGYRGSLAVGRHFVAHLIATSGAAILVFCAIVILRAVVGMVARGHAAAALASLLQFLFIGALFGFIILAPDSTNVRPMNRGIVVTAAPSSMPTAWFVGLSERLRGTGGPQAAADGRLAALATLAAIGAAVLLTFAAYRRQFQTALAPAATTGRIGRARLARALARAITGSNRVARAASDFVLMTIVRNRAPQTPIAINAALGLALIVLKFEGPGNLAAALQTPAVVLTVPLMMVFWVGIGIRASFFVPCELPAAWSFRANAPGTSRAYARGTRAAIVALMAPPAVLLALAVAAPILGWAAAVRHATFVFLLLVAFADFIVLTVNHIPFTRPYLPGHAKLKARWPLYVFGAYGFTSGLTALELYAENEPHGTVMLLSLTALVVAVFELAVAVHSIKPGALDDGDLEDEPSNITVLDLKGFAPT